MDVEPKVVRAAQGESSRSAEPRRQLSIADLAPLYMRSAGVCAMCRRTLTWAGSHKPLHLAEMAHIIPRSAGGPRGRCGSLSDVDSVENLIILCPSCHTIADKDEDAWPSERLSVARNPSAEWQLIRNRQLDSHSSVSISWQVVRRNSFASRLS